jgi:hypothetical protein
MDNTFAVRDIESINRIELCDSDHHTILSKTANDEWFVASFRANSRKIQNLKTILSDIEVRYPLPEMFDSVYSRQTIINEGIQLILFEGKRTVKSYHLLFTDDERAKIIALISGRQKPYVVELPGIDIDFGDYIVTETAFWEDNVLFSYNLGQIRYLRIDNRIDPDNSFSIRITDSISIFDCNGNGVTFDRSRADTYLSYFSNISFDRNLDIDSDEQQTISSIAPLYVMTIHSTIDSLTCYISPIHVDSFDDYGNPLTYDRDSFYLIVPQKNLFAIARWLDFDILLEDLNFLKRTINDKL